MSAADVITGKTVSTDRGPRDTGQPIEEIQDRLTHTWSGKSGWWGSLLTVDHKVIGRRYIVTAFIFLPLGGLLSLVGSTVAFALYRVPLARAIRGDTTSSLLGELGGSWLRFLGGPVGAARAKKTTGGVQFDWLARPPAATPCSSLASESQAPCVLPPPSPPRHLAR